MASPESSRQDLRKADGQCKGPEAGQNCLEGQVAVKEDRRGRGREALVCTVRMERKEGSRP